MPLLLAVAGCSDSEPTPAASASERPCMNELCRTYEQGYRAGEQALVSGEEVTLSPAERARLPVSDGTVSGAVEADMAVAKILCGRKAEEFAENDPMGVDQPEYREAFVDGCTDGALPGGSGKLSRHKYEEVAPS
ncbi:hypothetical protein [Streptomyces sp. WAC08241]|uniref:hypothetical protein n=1 Tax=Streptomyces sp. WAC08241 TaxID=2487421 RepID=UPI000F76877B|nr:hypothetical protein [Streptomyces sp. WAC08241]RSS46226.1 hypothetical protein EF906_02655 [Streptomyces sp. WAC08241]